MAAKVALTRRMRLPASVMTIPAAALSKMERNSRSDFFSRTSASCWARAISKAVKSQRSSIGLMT